MVILLNDKIILLDSIKDYNNIKIDDLYNSSFMINKKNINPKYILYKLLLGSSEKEITDIYNYNLVDNSLDIYSDNISIVENTHSDLEHNISCNAYYNEIINDNYKNENATLLLGFDVYGPVIIVFNFEDMNTRQINAIFGSIDITKTLQDNIRYIHYYTQYDYLEKYFDNTIKFEPKQKYIDIDKDTDMYKDILNIIEQNKQYTLSMTSNKSENTYIFDAELVSFQIPFNIDGVEDMCNNELLANIDESIKDDDTKNILIYNIKNILNIFIDMKSEPLDHDLLYALTKDIYTCMLEINDFSKDSVCDMLSMREDINDDIHIEIMYANPTTLNSDYICMLSVSSNIFCDMIDYMIDVFINTEEYEICGELTKIKNLFIEELNNYNE